MKRLASFQFPESPLGVFELLSNIERWKQGYNQLSDTDYEHEAFMAMVRKTTPRECRVLMDIHEEQFSTSDAVRPLDAGPGWNIAGVRCQEACEVPCACTRTV